MDKKQVMSNQGIQFKAPVGFELKFFPSPAASKGHGMVLLHPDDYEMIKDSLESEATKTPHVRMEDKDTLQPPTGREEISEGLTPQMSRDLDRIQKDWASIDPQMRGFRRLMPMTTDEAYAAYNQADLRRLVDLVWNAVTESEEVPSTEWADRIINEWIKDIIKDRQ